MAGKEASPKYSCPSYNNLQCGGRWKIQWEFPHTLEVSFATPVKQNLQGKHSWWNMVQIWAQLKFPLLRQQSK